MAIEQLTLQLCRAASVAVGVLSLPTIAILAQFPWVHIPPTKANFAPVERYAGTALFQNPPTVRLPIYSLFGKWKGEPPEEVPASSLTLLPLEVEEKKTPRCPHHQPKEVVIVVTKAKVSEADRLCPKDAPAHVMPQGGTVVCDAPKWRFHVHYPGELSIVPHESATQWHASWRCSLETSPTAVFSHVKPLGGVPSICVPWQHRALRPKEVPFMLSSQFVLREKEEMGGPGQLTAEGEEETAQSSPLPMVTAVTGYPFLQLPQETKLDIQPCLPPPGRKAPRRPPSKAAGKVSYTRISSALFNAQSQSFQLRRNLAVLPD